MSDKPLDPTVTVEQMAKAQNMATAMCAYLSETISPDLPLADATKEFEERVINYATGLIQMFTAEWEEVKANRKKLSGAKVLHLPDGKEHVIEETGPKDTP